MTSQPTRILELLRWGTVVAIERVRSGKPPIHPNKLLALMVQACLSPWDEPSRKLVEHLFEHARERVDSGALHLQDLIRTLDDSPLFRSDPPPGELILVISEDDLRWADENLADESGQVAIRGTEIGVFAGGMFHMLRTLVSADMDAWMQCLTGGDGDRVTAYASLCTAMINGVAFEQDLIPPWISDEYLIRWIRAARSGPESLYRVTESCLAELGYIDPDVPLPNGSGIWRPELAHRRRAILLEEMRLRDWGDDPRILDPEQLAVLAQVVRDRPDWQKDFQ